MSSNDLPWKFFDVAVVEGITAPSAQGIAAIGNTYTSILDQDMDFKITLPGKVAVETVPKGEPFFNYISSEMLLYYPRSNKNYGKGGEGRGIDSIQFVNVKELLARFFVGVYYNWERIKNWRSQCIGITSMISPTRGDYSGNQMPMFDYDGNVKKKIKKDVAEFQKKYELGDAWVYRTKRGYHVYFFCDQISQDLFMQMVGEAECCPGFKEQTASNGFATLRVSAKYTNFDIELEYILRNKNPSVVKRPLKKAHIVQELLSLGQQCGTHLASLYPQWALFKEDPKEWRSPAKSGVRRVRRKSNYKNPFTQEELIRMKQELYRGVDYEAEKAATPDKASSHMRYDYTRYNKRHEIS